MTTYDGPATATADGTEYDVTAHLGGGLREWRGAIEAEDDGAAWQIQEARSATLRTAEGSEGKFFAIHLQAGSTELQIQGSGQPPFGP